MPPTVIVTGAAFEAVNVAWLECKLRTIPLVDELLDVVVDVVVAVPLLVVLPLVVVETVFRV